MRITQDHLIFKALCALDEAVEQSRGDAVCPTFALRFSLAYLFAVSKRDDRKVFDEFWRAIQDGQAQAHSEEMGRYIRGSVACTCLQRICRAVGIEYNVQFARALSDARKPGRTR